MDVEEITALVYLFARNRRRQRRNRIKKYWVHPLLEARREKGLFVIFFNELKQYEDKFFNYTRMSTRSFEELLMRVRGSIEHMDTTFRESISAEERLIVTIRYLATGCSYAELYYTFRIGISTISEILREVCRAIWLNLRAICMPQPKKDDWINIANGFKNHANFPNCIGAIDGKHIRVIKPSHSGSMYYNYKSYFSVVLMALCDAEYRFIAVDVGASGKFGDSTIFKKSVLYEKIENGDLDIPAPSPISQTNPISMPYVIVGDEAFALSKNLMRPYPGKNLSKQKRIFNFRLCRARRFVECSFGILANKWRIFHRAVNVDIQLTNDIIKACCILHNFVRERDGFRFEDTLHLWPEDIEREDVENNDGTIRVRPRKIPTQYRNLFAEYFEGEGKLEWQEKYLKL